MSEQRHRDGAALVIDPNRDGSRGIGWQPQRSCVLGVLDSADHETLIEEEG